MGATTKLLQELALATKRARDEAVAARADRAIIDKLTRRALDANTALRVATRVTA